MKTPERSDQSQFAPAPSHHDARRDARRDARHDAQRNYLRLGAMVTTSIVVMFGLTYVNTYEWGHIRWSETRVYMALLMGAAMSLIMLGFMHGMYRDRRFNVAIVAGAALLFSLGLVLVRSQATVDDTSYMDAMIPHHSIAILTSEHAQIDDVRVCQLAARISETQRKEIREMSWLVEDIQAHGVASTADEAAARAVPNFSGASDRTCQ